MSCNYPTPNQCPENTLSCLCGITLNIFNSTGVLVETVEANTIQGEITYYEVNNSTAFESELGVGYVLTIYYNALSQRWEMSYYNQELDLDIVIGVLYGLQSTDCPLNNCWDLDCIAVGFNILNVFDSYFSWGGDYTNGKKSYEFTSDWSGSDINYRVYWTSDSSVIPGSATPVGTPGWILEEEDVFTPGIWSPAGFLFNSNPCLYGQYITEFGGFDTRFSFEDLGVTGFDMKTTETDCGCCDESVIIDIVFDESTFNDVQANIVKDEYGNVLTINGKPYYTFDLLLIPTSATFYLYYTGSSWVMSDSLDEEGAIYAELTSNNDCPFGSYTLFRGPVSLFSVIGSDCFDCCDYYAPRNRNLLKKKKAIFVDEISSIRNKEIFGLKCGPEWSDLFKKHLIFDVLWCLPYGVLCDDEEQCLINNLNENCNC
jgi:hypothetical protein